MKNKMLSKRGSIQAAWRRGILTFVTSVGLAFCPLTLAAQSVTLLWNPSPSPGVTGYKIYYGNDGINFDNQLDAGTNTSWTVTGLTPGSTNYFEAVAYDANGDESPPSNQLEYTVPAAAQTLTVEANPGGAGNVTGGGSFNAGSSVTVTATANSGYTFANWTANGVVQSASASYTFTLTTNVTLVANFTANPVIYTVTTQANPAQGGSVAGGGSFNAGSSVTVTATANSGYTFTNWTANGVVQSASASYTFTVTTNVTLVANFTANPVIYTVTTQANPTQGGSVAGGGSFNAGSSVTVTATSNSGYTFTNWTANGVVQNASASYTFTVTTNVTLVANFTANPVIYTVTTQANPANAGSTKGGGAFAAGTSVTVSATANNGFGFTNWTQNGAVQSASPNYSFSVTGNVTLVANFAAISVTTNASTNTATFTITSSAGPNGSISPNGTQAVAGGGGAAFTATPANGYQVNQWLVNGAVAQAGGSAYALQNVATNYTLFVTFVTNSVSSPTTNANTKFALLISGKGTLAPSRTAKSLQTGRKYTLTAVPGKGSVFAGWSSNGLVVETAAKYTFVVESNVVLQASFVPNPFVSVAGNYRGLFYVTNDAAEESSGSIAAAVTTAGAYSASIRLGGGSHSFSGAFSVNGAASRTIQRHGSTPLTVELQLGLTNGPLTGTVSDGTWTADLVADVAVYSKADPAPQAGKYTLLIPGSENASVQPGGNGFGSVTVSESGHVTFSGILGDGTPVSSGGIVSSEGQWPLYASLYGGRGSILGWLCFTNDGGISGQIGWFKLAQAAARLYPDGFTNSVQAMGSLYQYTNGLPLLGFTQGQLTLTNGDLAQGITDQVGFGAGMETRGEGTADEGPINLTFHPSSGLFKGSVLNPATGKPIAIHGAVLQNQDLAAGFFLGADQSGSVLLSPAP